MTTKQYDELWEQWENGNRGYAREEAKKMTKKQVVGFTLYLLDILDNTKVMQILTSLFMI